MAPANVVVAGYAAMRLFDFGIFAPALLFGISPHFLSVEIGAVFVLSHRMPIISGQSTYLSVHFLDSLHTAFVLQAQD
jgi:hypothetical protein